MKDEEKKRIKEEANQSKGTGNPGGSQSGGKKEKETTEELKEESRKAKEKRGIKEK